MSLPDNPTPTPGDTLTRGPICPPWCQQDDLNQIPTDPVLAATTLALIMHSGADGGRASLTREDRIELNDDRTLTLHVGEVEVFVGEVGNLTPAEAQSFIGDLQAALATLATEPA